MNRVTKSWAHVQNQLDDLKKKNREIIVNIFFIFEFQRFSFKMAEIVLHFESNEENISHMTSKLDL